MKKILLNCLALDDEPLALKILENYINQIPSIHSIGFFTNPEEAKMQMDRNQVDLLFLDIQMPDVNGIQFFRSLPEKPLVIFSTAYRNFAVESYTLQAVDYIVKPYDFERFHQAINKAIDYYTIQRQLAKKHLFVYSSYQLVKILLTDIRYIETFDDYLKIHLASTKKNVYTLMTMKEMEASLPPHQFLRVHRSFIVNLHHIHRKSGKKIILDNQELPIGKTYAKRLRQLFKDKSV